MDMTDHVSPSLAAEMRIHLEREAELESTIANLRTAERALDAKIAELLDREAERNMEHAGEIERLTRERDGWRDAAERWERVAVEARAKLAEVERLRDAAIDTLQRETHRRLVDAWDACLRAGRPYELRHAVTALDEAAYALRSARAEAPAPAVPACTCDYDPAITARRWHAVTCPAPQPPAPAVPKPLPTIAELEAILAAGPDAYRTVVNADGSINAVPRESAPGCFAPTPAHGEAERPHAVGDWWRDEFGDDRCVMEVRRGPYLRFDGDARGPAINVDHLLNHGWRRLPAAGDGHE